MDNGLMGRSQRPTDRQRVAAARAQGTARPAQEAPVAVAQQPVRHVSPQGDTTQRPKRNWLKVVFIVLGIIVILAGAWFAWSHLKGGSGAAGIDKSKYQAVFFTNGQVYFGKLTNVNEEFMKLTDVYYLQAEASESEEPNPQETSTGAEAGVRLIKLGEEMHAPEDEMTISKKQIMLYENIKDSGKVVQSIEAYKKSQN